MKIGIDIGGSHIGIGVINENGEIIEKTETDLEANNNMQDFVQSYLISNTKSLIQQYPIEAIGVAAPGTPKDGKITTLVNLGIAELDMVNMFKQICNIPVSIHNDAKCAGLAEKKYGSLAQYQDAVFMCLGTGIGGAVFMDDKLLTPKRNPGFELGHMIIEKDGKLCNCGKNGCFETYCSMKRLKAQLMQALLLPQDTTAKDLLQILKDRKQEDDVKRIIDEYLDNLVIGISNIIDIFEPQVICLGGSFVYFEEILYKELLDKYYKKCYVFNKKDLPEIKLATLGNDAGLVGACAFDA